MKWSIKRRGRFWEVRSGATLLRLTPFFFKRLQSLFESGQDIKDIEQELYVLLKERVLNFLSLRDRSEEELKRYVDRLGLERLWPKTKRWLKHLNLLNDYRFASNFVDYQKRRLVGPLYIAHQLRLRGVREKIIEEVLNKRYTKQEQRRKVVSLVKRYKKYRSLAKTQDKAKLLRYLASRGFTREIIYEIISKYVD